MPKTLMAKPQIHWTRPFNPLERPFTRNENNLKLDPPHFAISASLSGEEDFELNGEFLEVFVRAGERVAGFLVGCMVIAGVWMIHAAL
jgi:hypothetical protein